MSQNYQKLVVSKNCQTKCIDEHLEVYQKKAEKLRGQNKVVREVTCIELLTPTAMFLTTKTRLDLTPEDCI